jgi:ABC-type transport system substrate-binding protein/DNA-binding SARP family transcriptional activator/DNA-binding beta-propeller fold protein YncE
VDNWPNRASSGNGSGWEFRVLGPLEVRRAGEVVAVGGPRQRLLLARMLCSANQVVRRDELLHLLDEGTSPDPGRALRVQVSRLRKVLDPDPTHRRLTLRPTGYVLQVEPGELDVAEFEFLTEQGRQLAAEGRPELAVDAFRRAERLWRGPPFGELETDPSAVVEIHRLKELRTGAAEERIDIELSLGRHAAVCAELEGLVADHPFRERLRRQLMLAMYLSGRQADALSVYRDGRELMRTELGLEPAPDLQLLQQIILRHEPVLNGTPSPSPHVDPPTSGVSAPGLLEHQAVESATGRARGSDPEHGQPAAASPSPHRVRLVTVVLAVVCTFGLGAVVAVRGGDGGDPAAPRQPVALTSHHWVALLDQDSGAVLATVPLSARPADLTTGADSVWVAEPAAGMVVRINPERRAVMAAIPVGQRPLRLAASGEQVWVADGRARTISRVDGTRDAVAQTVAVGYRPVDLDADSRGVWLLDPVRGAVDRVQEGTGEVRRLAVTGSGASGLAVTAGTIWVTNRDRGTVEGVDIRTGAIGSIVHVGDGPTGVAVDEQGVSDRVWVLDRLDAALTLVRTDSAGDSASGIAGGNRMVVPVGGAPVGLAASGGIVWVADRGGALWRVDPDRPSTTLQVRLRGDVDAVASGPGLWVAGDRASSEHLGGTLTALRSLRTVDTLDPAASTSVNLAPPQFFGLTNDGLVTLNHALGAAGRRLVPDLALEVPTATHHRRAYLFHLRPGISYSTGAPVLASDVTHTFERLFQLNSAGAAYFADLRGARSCDTTPPQCDLSRGVMADDRAGTVRFRLTAPDPDFLEKLTLAYADIVPATTPGREAREPLPATGPYRIASYLPGRRLVMNRNPQFHEWSAAAQPAGRPDRIVLRLGMSVSQMRHAMASGAADYVSGFGTDWIGGHLATLRTRSNPVMSTGGFFLNVGTPPFDDVRARRAINFALDRSRAVAQWGGPRAATPTCQILPPGMPGYRQYCPYTARPGGEYRGPDLARARRLVAASGTLGQTVTVWATGVPGDRSPGARDVVRTLRRIGYRAALRLLPDSTFNAYTNDSRNHAQVIEGGWTADYPSSNNFLGKLTCAYVVPGDATPTTNASGYCNPAFDRGVRRALFLQASDPAAADAAWSRLDRRLTDEAIWIPTVTPRQVDVLSTRVRHYRYHPVWGALLDQLSVR